jgi:transcriptional accessory protein Tex/SPT6
MKSSRLCEEMSESVNTSEQTITLFGKQIERLEKEMEKVTKFGAKKMDVKDQIDMVRMMIENIDNRVGTVKKKIELTDVYVDRYLPCKILNMIKDVTEESLSDYNDNKIFLTKL